MSDETHTEEDDEKIDPDREVCERSDSLESPSSASPLQTAPGNRAHLKRSDLTCEHSAESPNYDAHTEAKFVISGSASDDLRKTLSVTETL
jgi:hypothetical protein